MLTRFQALYTENKTNGCFEWNGFITRHGYGQFTVSTKRKAEAAHRVSYELFVGAIPQGLFVLHACDNRKCVNPAHLSVGTASDNMRDMVAKGRGNNAVGERNKGALLTKTQVITIRAVRMFFNSNQEIADIYGVGRRCIDRIIKGELWKHLLPNSS